MTDIPAGLWLRVLALLAIGALLAGCAAARSLGASKSPTPTELVCGVTGTPAAHAAALRGTPSAPDYWPTEDWRTAAPASHNVDEARLRAMMDYIKLKGLDIKSVVVIRDGYVVFEQYGPGQGPQSRGEVFSVTKSFASTLIGIAQRKGLLGGLDEPILSLLPGEYENMDERKEAMTLDDALTMRTGLTWSDDADLDDFYTASDPVAHMLGLAMAEEPGEDFNYCSGCSHLLMAVVEKATGMKPQEFAREELLAPLGVADPQWLTDRNGMALGGWGLQLSAREMAKLGYLFLRGGTWDGRQIVTPAWVRLATTAQTTTDGPNGYGYQWWTHPKFPAYMALGRGGQTVYVRPDKDLVVSIRAQLPNHDAIYTLIETYIEPAVKF